MMLRFETFSPLGEGIRLRRSLFVEVALVARVVKLLHF